MALDEENQYGIEETWDAVDYVLTNANYAAQIEVWNLSTVLDGISRTALQGIKAFAGWDRIPKELKDLQEAEVQELLARTKAKYDIPDDAVEGVVEAALTVVAGIGVLVIRIQDLKSPLQQ